MSNTPLTDEMPKFCFGDDREYVRVKDAKALELKLRRYEEALKAMRYLAAKKGETNAITEFIDTALYDTNLSTSAKP